MSDITSQIPDPPTKPPTHRSTPLLLIIVVGLVTALLAAFDLPRAVADGSTWNWTAGPQPEPMYDALSVALADLDADGHLDIAAGTLGHGVYVWRGDGGYGWTRAGDAFLPDHSSWPGVAWGQINNLGDLDLAAASDGAGLRAWASWQGGLVWEDISDGLDPNGDYQALALEHVDHDGALDLVACGDWLGVRVWQGTGGSAPPYWAHQTTLSAGQDYCAVALGYVNADGHLDVVAANSTVPELPVWLGDGAFGFTAAASPAVGDSYSAVALEDLDKDDHVDIVAAPASGGVQIWWGDGGFTWADGGVISPTLRILSLDVDDFDGDGYLDILAGKAGGVHVWRGDGGTSWSDASGNLPTTYQYRGVAFGPVDADAALDVVGAESGTSGVRVWTATEPPPGDWSNFRPHTAPPSIWVQTQRVTCTVQVADIGSGLAVSTARYRFSRDGGASWVGDWLTATCSGADGVTATQVITAADVAFDQDSRDQNVIQFCIQDLAGVTGTSPSYAVAIDATPPTLPMLHSTTHAPGTWHNSRNIQMLWPRGMDSTSGVWGHSYVLDTVPDTLPDETVDTESEAALVRAPADGDNWYFHLRTRDRAGNWNTAIHRGPFYVDTQPPIFCTINTPGVATDDTIPVSWSGADTASGIASYEVEVSEWYHGHSAGWLPWLETDATAGVYTGTSPFAIYHFRMRARDQAGNVSAYAYSGSTSVDLPPPDVRLSISIDDAFPGRSVPKLIPDAAGPANRTWVDVKVGLAPVDDPIDFPFTLRLNKPADLGDPVSVRIYTDSLRLSEGEALFWSTSRTATRATIPSLPDHRYVVFRFGIAPGTPVGTYRLWADIPEAPAAGSSGSVNLYLDDWAYDLVLTNRTRLFQEFDDFDTICLLRSLYDLLWPHYVYYVDDYSPAARDWDPLAVTYWDGSTNAVADAIDDLIEDWSDDATTTWVGSDPIPNCLLLAGDDPIIPYHRVPCPRGDEVRYAYTDTHPILVALTQNDGFFSDAKYADLDDVNWQRRPTDLATSRLVGLTAMDMWTFIESGMEKQYVSNGNFVAATWFGCDFPPELDVLMWDYDILYDGEGEPWDMVESDEWLLSDLWRAMQVEFAAMHYGGHGEHDLITTPNGGRILALLIHYFSHSGGHYDETHPFFYFAACRVGFSPADSTDSSMLYALAREGASGAIASMGISGASRFYDRHVRTYDDPNWSEKLLSCFWCALPGPGITPGTCSFGPALRCARTWYDPGREWDAGDEKAIMEYTLFGLPWTRMSFPRAFDRAAADSEPAPPAPFSPAFTAPQPAGAAHTYRVQTTIDASDYVVTTDVITGFDLLEVEGLGLSWEPDRPVLPMAHYTMTLPAGAEIVAVDVTTIKPVILADLHLPVYVPAGRYSRTLGVTEPPPTMTLFPTQICTYHVACLDGACYVHFYLSPAVYDAPAKEATLYRGLDLTVTYRTTSPIVLDRTYVMHMDQPPDQPVVLGGLAMNVGSEALTIIPQVTLDDARGHTFGPQASAPVSLPPGGASWLTASYTSSHDLPEGFYRAQLTLWQTTTCQAEAAVDVRVVGGVITRLRGPDTVLPGGTATFTMTFRNNQGVAVSIVPWLTVSELGGDEVASLSGMTQTVPANGEATFTLTWVDAPDVQELLVVHAQAARVPGDSIGDIYGPATRFILPPPRTYLPVAARGGSGR